MTGVAYNPSDPTQQAFLSALALGESGSNGSLFEGFGSTPGHVTDLSSAPRDAFGFPQWGGVGDTHATGIYQFQPATWDGIASQYGLNFGNAADQNAGAWYLAQQKDPNLEADLQSGAISKVQSALGSTWTSITGSQFVAALTGQIPGASIPAGATAAGGGAAASGTAAPGIIDDIENWFLRGGLILVGGIVVIIALWGLFAHYSNVPGPTQTARAVAAAA